jgi:hypothetical protein
VIRLALFLTVRFCNVSDIPEKALFDGGVSLLENNFLQTGLLEASRSTEDFRDILQREACPRTGHAEA